MICHEVYYCCCLNGWILSCTQLRFAFTTTTTTYLPTSELPCSHGMGMSRCCVHTVTTVVPVSWCTGRYIIKTTPDVYYINSAGLFFFSSFCIATLPDERAHSRACKNRSTRYNNSSSTKYVKTST